MEKTLYNLGACTICLVLVQKFGILFQSMIEFTNLSKGKLAVLVKLLKNNSMIEDIQLRN